MKFTKYCLTVFALVAICCSIWISCTSDNTEGNTHTIPKDEVDQYDSDYFLRMANSELKEGNCESAKDFYDVYKNHFHKTDTCVESQIKKCGGDTSNAVSIHENYTETTLGINMKMVWVEGGEFMMGCTSEQSDCDEDEMNVRRVTVDGFYIGMIEVTQSQWEAVIGTNIYIQENKARGTSTYGYSMDPESPMCFVNWDEAMEFCRLLSNSTGKTYTLPTEAQWEYAARGGKNPDGTKYAGSNDIDAVAWYSDNCSGSTHVCGSKCANSLGIYDMSGNVDEWCKDLYRDCYDRKNHAGASSVACRVLRGGHWYCLASSCRVSERGYSLPSYRNVGIGFRIVCIP